MKKIIILMVMALVILAGAFSADIQIGVMQNLINTSFIFDAEMEHFGFETAIGMPVVPLAVSGLEALFKGNDDGSSGSGAIARGEGDEEESGSSGFAIPAGAMANIYFKVVNGRKFSLRLGLEADIIGIYGTDSVWTELLSGPSFGFNFKFNDSLAMNFTSTIPFAVFLPESVAKYTYFIYSTEENALGNIILAIYGTVGAVGCQLARLSFKWTV